MLDTDKKTLPDNVTYASFNLRLIAALIDSLLSIIPLYPVYLIYVNFSDLKYSLTGIKPNDMTYEQQIEFVIQSLQSTFIQTIILSVIIVVFWIYKSATPGKMILKMKIVDAETLGKPSKAQCIGRFFASFIALIPFGMGFIWISFDKRKQGWHDKLARTVVIVDKK